MWATPRKYLVAALVAALASVAVSATPPPPDAQRAALLALAGEIRAADYAGDRPRLAGLAEKVASSVSAPELAAAAGYWRGFAYWRRAINGFNEAATPEELEADLAAAIAAFEPAFADPAFEADAKSAAAACWMSRAFLASQADPDLDWAAWAGRYLPLMKEALTEAPDNPRVAWVWGAQVFYAPEAAGGGQEKALALLREGLADAAAERAAGDPCADSLVPRWGLAEMLMNLGYFESQKSEPDLGAAEAYARAALALRPDWHYVRDILLPQIEGRRSVEAAAAAP